MTQQKIILKFSPNEQIITTKSTLSILPYFKYIFDNYQTPNEIFVDKDKTVVNHCLEICRNSELYEYPEWVEPDWEYFQVANNGYIYPDNEIIKINVSGDIFWTTKNTLFKSDMLSVFLNKSWQKNTNDNDNDEIFLDRNPIAFKHVLSYLRNINYPFPEEYLYELKYYGIVWMYDVDENDVKNLKEIDDIQNDHDFHKALVFNTAEYNDGMKSNFTPFNYPKYENDLKVFKVFVSRNPISKNIPQISTLKEFKSKHNNNNIWGKLLSYHLNNTNNFDNSNNSDNYDMLHKLFIQIYIPGFDKKDFKNPEMLPFNIINSIRIYSDECQIDEMSGELLYIWMKLYHPKDYYIFCQQQKDNYLILPLYFFFHENKELSLNIHSTYSRLHIDIDIEHLSNIVNINSTKYHNTIIKLIGNVIHLSRSERLYINSYNFYNSYLQHSYCTKTLFFNNNFNISLNYTGLVCQILFTIVPESEDDSFDKYNYQDVLKKAVLKSNNNIICQINGVSNIIDKYINNISNPDIPIYTMTFGILDKNNLHNESSGNINFDRIDNIVLQFELNHKIQRGIVKLWYVRYNTLFLKNSINSRLTYVKWSN